MWPWPFNWDGYLPAWVYWVGGIALFLTITLGAIYVESQPALPAS
jgi:hypothetical protein